MNVCCWCIIGVIGWVHKNTSQEIFILRYTDRDWPTVNVVPFSIELEKKLRKLLNWGGGEGDNRKTCHKGLIRFSIS